MGCGCRGNVQQTSATVQPVQQQPNIADVKLNVGNNINASLEQSVPVVKNVGYNILDVIQDKITGNLKYVDKDVSNARLAQCHSCPNLKIGMCTKCGCIVEFKTRYEQSSCPEGKW